ncbi:expressed unknown protein [Seminavis robusta]|uniref:Uncharacterized protein n=1 Tax=Seminavis robusta TaxID=568900 RepID=A0A9N8HK64_9STRA|nr:expressed unknown protein [Seminavis robusta]|eukprot:Sro733_g194590.1 n/a (300) ;mRNA; r:36072-36971
MSVAAQSRRGSVHQALIFLASLVPSVTALSRKAQEREPSGFFHKGGHYSYTSWSSSDSSSSDSGDNPSNDDAMAASLVAVGVGLLIFASFFVFLLCCNWTERRQRQRFAKSADKARADVVKDAAKMSTNKEDAVYQHQLPFTRATFSAVYVGSKDWKEGHGCKGTLTFDTSMDKTTHSERSETTTCPASSYTGGSVLGDEGVRDGSKTHACWSTGISGVGKDQDGPFAIIEGKLSPFSGKCYWVEESVAVDNKSETIKVLVTGCITADAEAPSFQGHWESSNGSKGSFARFDLDPNNKN